MTFRGLIWFKKFYHQHLPSLKRRNFSLQAPKFSITEKMMYFCNIYEQNFSYIHLCVCGSATRHLMQPFHGMPQQPQI